MKADIIGYIFVKKMTSTDQYWQSYGPASFDFKTRHRIIQLRRAITQSISVRWRPFFHENVANDVGYISMYDMEKMSWYWRRYGSAGFGMRNQPYHHSKINNYTETWYFFIIFSVYYRVGIYLIVCKLLDKKTSRKGFIIPPSHGIHCKCNKIKLEKIP